MNINTIHPFQQFMLTRFRLHKRLLLPKFHRHSATMIGTQGIAWGDAERALWLSQQTIKRSYQDEVLSKIEKLKSDFDVVQYGALASDKDRYPLFSVRSKNWDNAKPTVVITGGVHGYETSGVQGAIRFIETTMNKYVDTFNIVVCPCVSPWGYETINRWTQTATDPNRSFQPSTGFVSEEADQVKAYIASLNPSKVIAHFDLHETTDTDATVFGPTKAARDGYIESDVDIIPDGFYTVGDSLKDEPAFQTAVIKSVEKVTHIAPGDLKDGKMTLIDVLVEQLGVINLPCKELGLCASFTEAKYVTTTEVYPDSPKANAEICTVAQVAAVVGGLDYIIANKLHL